jgi:tetratricopeptide (TPR) repeat protein
VRQTSRLRAALAAALILCPWRAVAGAAQDFDSRRWEMLRTLWAEKPWDALRSADALVALPGLLPSQRAEALRRRAEIRSRLGDRSGAEADFRRALESDPGDVRTLAGLARAVRDRPDEALRYADQAVLSASGGLAQRRALDLAAELRLDAGDEAGAKARAERALGLSGGDLDALRLLVRTSRGRPAEAAGYARRAAEAAQSSPLWQRASALALCADIWLEIDAREEAAACLARALELAPDDVPLLRKLADVERRGPVRPAPPAPASAPAGGAPDELGDLGRLLIARVRASAPGAHAAVEAFMDGLQDAPPWQRSDAYRLGTKVWVEVGEETISRACLERAHDLDWNMMAKMRVFDELAASTAPHCVRFPDSELEYSELEMQFAQAARLRLDLGDAAGAEATADRGLVRVPGSVQLMKLKVDMDLKQTRLGEALAYAERLEARTRAETPADVVARSRTKDFLRKYVALNHPESAGADDRTCVDLYLTQPAALAEATQERDNDRVLAAEALAAVRRAREADRGAPR